MTGCALSLTLSPNSSRIAGPHLRSIALKKLGPNTVPGRSHKWDQVTRFYCDSDRKANDWHDASIFPTSICREKLTESRTGVVSDRFSETGPAVGLEAAF